MSWLPGRLALFESLEFDFLKVIQRVRSQQVERTRDQHPPELFRVFLHCSTRICRLCLKLIQSLDEVYCDEKHAHRNGDYRFQRAGTTTRTVSLPSETTNSTLHHGKDTAATDDDLTDFRSIENFLEFDGQRIYQGDILLQVANLATSLSYRDAVAVNDGFTSMP